MKEKQFQRYFRRLSVEGILRALLLALASGACATVVSGIVTWFYVTENIGLSLGINVGVFLAATVLFAPVWYFVFFRPTVGKSAQRIDRLGLEERMITMVELQGEDSIIAKLQREDAKQNLQKVAPRQLKLRIPKKILVFLLIAFVCGAGATTVAALGAAGYIYSGYETMDAIIPEEPPVYVNVVYLSTDGGLVEGEFDQRIVLGENTSEVLAVAEDGFEFVQWSDGLKDPARSDRNVQGDMEIWALFQYVGEPTEDENGDPSEDEDNQRPKPQDQQNNNSQDPDDNSDPAHSPSKYEPYNQIIDGQTFFKDVLQQYKDAAVEDMADSGETDREGNSIADAYYNIIN